MSTEDLADEDPYYGEGWIWLPPEEVARLQAEKSRIMRAMMDNVACASPPLLP